MKNQPWSRPQKHEALTERPESHRYQDHKPPIIDILIIWPLKTRNPDGSRTVLQEYVPIGKYGVPNTQMQIRTIRQKTSQSDENEMADTNTRCVLLVQFGRYSKRGRKLPELRHENGSGVTFEFSRDVGRGDVVRQSLPGRAGRPQGHQERHVQDQTWEDMCRTTDQTWEDM